MALAPIVVCKVGFCIGKLTYDVNDLTCSLCLSVPERFDSSNTQATEALRADRDSSGYVDCLTHAHGPSPDIGPLDKLHCHDPRHLVAGTGQQIIKYAQPQDRKKDIPVRTEPRFPLIEALLQACK